MKRFLIRAIRPIADAIWGARGFNSFVYNTCLRRHVRQPDIPVRPVELYGQCGEDLIVESLIRAKTLRDDLDPTKQQYLEIGGNRPFATSATYLLHTRLGMTGLIVEANPRLIGDLKRGRPKDVVLQAAVYDQDVETVKLSISNQSEISSLDRAFVMQWKDGSVGEAALVDVCAMRINRIIQEFFNDKAPCFMSIDVEGLDLRLLKDFDFNRYRPWYVQTEPSDQYISGNTQAIISHMQSVRYRLIAATSLNLIFESEDAHV
jgi:hypothetical protein